MKSLMVAGLFAVLACQSQAQTTGSIPAGSKIYVDPATGFDTNLAEALKKQNVPVTITAQKNEAEYEFQTIAGANRIAGPDFASQWLHGYGEPEIRLVNLRTSEVIFTSLFERHLSLHDRDSAAEACAKRLQAGVNRSESILPSKQHPIVDF